MPIDELYLAASYLRDLAFKYERCQEEHSTEKWTAQDDKNLEELFKILLASDFPPQFEYDQKNVDCYEEIIEYVNDLVKNRLSTCKVPPSPHLASLLKELKALQEEAKKRTQKTQKEINELAKQRTELLKKLQQRFPKVHQSILEKIVDDFEASVLLESPQEALYKTAKAVNEIAKTFDYKEVDTEEVLKEAAESLEKETGNKNLQVYVLKPTEITQPLLPAPKLNSYQQQQIELALIKEFAAWGLSPTDALSAARTYMSLNMPFTTYAVSTFAAKPGLGNKQNAARQREAFRDFSETAFDRVLQQLNLLPKTQLTIEFDQLQQILAQAYAPQIRDRQSFIQRDLTGQITANPFLRFFWEEGANRVTSEVTKYAWDKFVTWAGGKAAQTAATTAVTTTAAAAETTALVAAPQTLGTSLLIVAAIELGKIAKKIPHEVWKARNFVAPIAVAFTAIVGGMIVAGMSFTQALIFGAGSGMTTAFIQIMGGPVAALTHVANGVTYLSSQFVGLVATEIAAPVIIIAISIPIVIALILFIITTSAFVVPVNLMNAPEYGSIVNPPLGPGGEYPNCWPIRGHISQGPYCSTGSFSHCSYVYGTNYRYGNSIDIKGVLGDSVYATHNGKAYPCPPSYDSSYGICVVVESSLGFKTIYAHLSDRITTTIDPITAGTLIGKRGSTGWSTGPHLHYELINSKGRQLPPPFTMPPPKAANGLVPTYQAGGPTTGCFANESGGSATGVQ